MPTEIKKEYENFMNGITHKAGNFNVKGIGKVNAEADPYAGYLGLL